MRKNVGGWAVVVFAAAVCGAAAGGLTYSGRAVMSESGAEPASRWVRLRAAMVDTAPTADAARRSGLARDKIEPAVWRAAASAGADALLPIIVQCRHNVSPPSGVMLADRAGAGGRLAGYLPDNAFVLLARADQLEALAGLPVVRWIGYFKPEYKLAPALRLDRPASAVDIALVTFAPAMAETVAAHIRASGGMVRDAAPGARRGVVRARAPAALIEQLAELPAVEWIEPAARPVWLNDVAAGAALMNVDMVRTNHGLTGAGQIVCVCDTGLDTGDPETIHPDFTNRVRAGFAWGRTNDWSDTMGHGTHCAGSVLGDGSAYSNGLFQGAAPAAELVMQSIAGVSNVLVLPADLNDLFRQAYTNGARLHSDSWGDSAAGAYTILSRQTDEFVWAHPDMLPAFAVGNSGEDVDMDGVVDAGSLSAPASAKNVLAVGAASTARSAGSGGYSSYLWGGFAPTKYPAAPIRDAPVSTPFDGLHQGMAPFSSRGPCQDGRIKPDIVAPGTDIVSTRSRMPGASVLWGTGAGVLANAASNYYTFSGGTSMSTPLTVGALTLVRQYYAERRGWTNPSAALLKATVAAGARSLAPGQFGFEASREIPAGARPNSVEGWGHVNLDATLFPAPGLTNMFEDARALDTGMQDVFHFTSTGSNRLSIVLAWTDYPSSEAAGVNLVNDLDLLVTAPDGRQYHANGLAGFDRLNNMEGVDISPAIPGVYTITIMGYNVPYGPQPYALVVHAAPAPPLAIAGVWHTPPLITNGMPPQVLAEIVPGGAPVTVVQCRYRVNAGAWREWGMMPQTAGNARMVYTAALPPPALGAELDYCVMAFDAAGGSAVSPTNTLRIQSPALYVSPAGRQVPPYDTPANAFTNVQAAVDYAVDGTLILVDAGRYDGVALRLEKPITVRSLAGASATVLAGAGDGSCVSNTARAVLDGFTITGGRAEQGGGVYLSVGSLRNCIIAGNTAWQNGGGVFNAMGSLDHCLIAGNTAANGGGIFQNGGGMISNCVIQSNTAATMGGGLIIYGLGGTGGEARNCLITGNVAGTGGGAVMAFGGRLVNATVSGNRADAQGGVVCLFYSELVNSIMYGNTPDNFGGEGMAQRPVQLKHCCTWPAVTGAHTSVEGMLIANPDFRDMAAGDFRLMVNSPCRDAGANEFWMIEAMDLAGQARIINDFADMGAYESCLVRDAFNMAARRHGAGDYDGDGRMDPAIYTAPAGAWRVWLSGADYRMWQALFGGADFVAVPGDYDGDGVTEPAVYHAGSGLWLRQGLGADGIVLGGAGYAPAPGDYDGDGRTDPAVYNADGVWFARLSGANYRAVTLALAAPSGAAPWENAAADYDGDGRTDPALYRAGDGLWTWALSSDNYRITTGWFGGAQYRAVPADYDGDGRADPAVYDAQSRGWTALMSRQHYRALAAVLPDAAGIPMPADYDGDGLEDPAVHDVAAGVWTAWQSSRAHAPASVVVGD